MNARIKRKQGITRSKISAQLFRFGCRATFFVCLVGWACIQLQIRDDLFEESTVAVDSSSRLRDDLPSANFTSDAATAVVVDSNSSLEANTSDAQPYERHSHRTLYGIFSYDSTNEANLRAANRGTHLNYYIKNRRTEKRADIICKLNVLLARPELAKDPESCQVIYTFVLGGLEGSEDNPNLRAKSSAIGRDMVPDSKTRCLYDDPDCGGADMTQWTMERPMSVSLELEKEIKLQDLTFLSILESHEYGKTDTWFTYASLLARQLIDLNIGFIGKIDSDNIIRWPSFFQYLKHNYEEEMIHEQYIYGGWYVPKDECSGNAYSRLCADGRFIGDGFASGAHNYISTELGWKVFLETPLARRKEVWFVGEDMQLANMVYSTSVRPFVINHRGGLGHVFINVHCNGDPGFMRTQYFLRQDRQFTAAMSEAAKKARAKDSGT
ncbi:hypothetical protein THAOC_31265 [Thalassiosira oceanica]|uniref:Uncharacterized protein n=1 Tax=Thalassiosira oceanica TaxID=159749 RepID=K0RC21_THAOC|nr:hypothetical protein THAOC_31265 [Thalassiosira oceanica]|eukprot:EJK49819.1 hypothetical protein THAOC_31265 [Thalassiosira oceanica]